MKNNKWTPRMKAFVLYVLSKNINISKSVYHYWQCSFNFLLFVTSNKWVVVCVCPTNKYLFLVYKDVWTCFCIRNRNDSECLFFFSLQLADLLSAALKINILYPLSFSFFCFSETNPWRSQTVHLNNRKLAAEKEKAGHANTEAPLKHSGFYPIQRTTSLNAPLGFVCCSNAATACLLKTKHYISAATVWNWISAC